MYIVQEKKTDINKKQKHTAKGLLHSGTPELYNEIFKWVIENKPIEGKKPEEVFGKNSKHALKVFFERIYAMSDECKKGQKSSYNVSFIYQRR